MHLTLKSTGRGPHSVKPIKAHFQKHSSLSSRDWLTFRRITVKNYTQKRKLSSRHSPAHITEDYSSIPPPHSLLLRLWPFLTDSGNTDLPGLPVPLQPSDRMQDVRMYHSLKLTAKGKRSVAAYFNWFFCHYCRFTSHCVDGPQGNLVTLYCMY